MLRPGQTGKSSSGRWVKLTALWGVSALVLSGMSAAAYVMMSSPPDPVALCERDVQIGHSTLVIIDTTDAFSENHKRRVDKTIRDERDRAPRGSKFSVIILNAADPYTPMEIVTACNPGRGDEVNQLFETASRTEKEWNEKFAAPIASAIAKAGEAGPAERSPIIETIAAALTRPDFDARIPHRRLVIISDLLEHEERYSQLAGGDFAAGYSRSILGRIAPLDLANASVALDYLQRPEFAEIQGAAHRQFWRGLFTEAGATEVNFIGLSDPPSGETRQTKETQAPTAAAAGRQKVKPPRKPTKKKKRSK